MHVMLTLYHSTFLIKMSCRKKTNALPIITSYQLSYNLTSKIKEYQIIIIDSIYILKKSISLSLTTLADFNFLLVKYHHISSSITLLVLTFRLCTVEIPIQIKN